MLSTVMRVTILNTDNEQQIQIAIKTLFHSYLHNVSTFAIGDTSVVHNVCRNVVFNEWFFLFHHIDHPT